jgi:2-polyprenyl-6-methoxyphenol hydroxylase-like FAD-dependent oxidoreductase
VLDASDPASMIAASIYGTASVPLWNTGRTTLLGDAIHAMSPAGGLGANTALNDARVLTECLADTDNDKSSLLASVGRYEEAMRAYGSSALRASNASAKALFDAM